MSENVTEKYYHQYSQRIEKLIQNLFSDYETKGVYEICTADNVDSNWSAIIHFGLGKIAATQKDKVLEFYDKYGYYLKFNLSELITFERPLNDHQLYNEHATGEEAVMSLIDSFSELCKKNKI